MLNSLVLMRFPSFYLKSRYWDYNLSLNISGLVSSIPELENEVPSFRYNVPMQLLVRLLEADFCQI